MEPVLFAAGGFMSLSAYWIIIWAMTVAPIATVAALRESSVLFAAVISVLILKEPLTRLRAIAAAIIVAGILLARTGKKNLFCEPSGGLPVAV